MFEGCMYALTILAAVAAICVPGIFAAFGRSRQGKEGRTLPLLLLGGLVLFGLYEAYGFNLCIKHWHGPLWSWFEHARGHAVLIGFGAAAALAVFWRIGRPRRPGVIASAIAGLAMAGLGTLTVGLTMPGGGEEGMLWLFLLPVAALVFLGLLIGGLLLLVRTMPKPIEVPPPIPVCPDCRYDLTGNVSGTCPECGGAFAEELKGPAAESLSEHWAARAPTETLMVKIGRAAYVLGGVTLCAGLAKVPLLGLVVTFCWVSQLFGCHLRAEPWPLLLARGVLLITAGNGLARRQRWAIWVCGLLCAMQIPLAVWDLWYATSRWLSLSRRLDAVFAILATGLFVWGLVVPAVMLRYVYRLHVQQRRSPDAVTEQK